MDIITEHFPTAEDALAYRQARSKRAKALNRQTAPTLRDAVRSAGLIFGDLSKDELVAAVLEVEYPLALEHEAIHILHHRDWQNSACEWCAPVVPGLAEHTEAACDTIARAAQ